MSGSGAAPLFDRLGRFAGLGQEMENIALASVIDYPGLQIKTAAVATARQSIAVHTGEGVLNSIWHTYGMIRRFTPQLVPAMHAARQQHGEMSFTAINRLHYPVALLSMALLPVIVLLACARDESRPTSANSPPPSRSRSRQRLRLRRNVQPARPLWRAHGLARGLRGHSGRAAWRRAGRLGQPAELS